MDTYTDTITDNDKEFLLAILTEVSEREITDLDFEYLIGLSAYSYALNNYTGDKANFRTYVKDIIQQRLIEYKETPMYKQDYKRKEEIRQKNEISKKTRSSDIFDLGEELNVASDLLKEYNITFFDIGNNRPTSRGKLDKVIDIIYTLINSPNLMDVMKETKKLPINTLAQICILSPKFIEKYKKFIMGYAILLEGNFQGLKKYLNFEG